MTQDSNSEVPEQARPAQPPAEAAEAGAEPAADLPPGDPATDGEDFEEDDADDEDVDPEVQAALASDAAVGPPPPPMSAIDEEIPEHTPTIAVSPIPELPLQTPEGTPAEIDPRRFDVDALKVVHRLHSFEHQAYFVGGCVRDLLLGRKPKDFDIATSATPSEVRGIFRNCRLIGRRFRLAHVYFKGGKIVEVSTFRANPTELEELEAAGNVELEGGEEERDDLLITQDNVFGTAEQDARRRDFTINGLFYDVFTGKVLDYVRGRRDLDQRQIRTIGDPETRMREDPVRILRAVRFACKLDLDIESRTYAAMEGVVEDLPRCAPPRLLEETFRLIRGGVAAPALKLLSALDALRILLPPIDRFLRDGGKAAEDSFFAHAAALDRKVASSPEGMEDAILLSALLLPLSRAAPAPPAGEAEEERPTVAQAIEELLRQFVQTARLPRRIAERTRMVLLAQRTLAGDRRRRGSLSSFRRHPLFNEALTVFEMGVEATSEGRDALDAWRSGGAPQVKPGAEVPSNRRRRRRHHRGGGNSGGA
jgi:poly(A) polymerase